MTMLIICMILVATNCRKPSIYYCRGSAARLYQDCLLVFRWCYYIKVIQIAVSRPCEMDKSMRTHKHCRHLKTSTVAFHHMF